MVEQPNNTTYLGPPHQVTLRELDYNSTTSTFSAQVLGTAPDTNIPVIVSVRSPFSTREEELDLQWYCEAADREPFSVSPRLARVEQSITRYGTHLFNMVFGTPDTTLPNNVTLTVRIMGSPLFCSLHWELLRDPKRGPVVLDLSRCLVREVPSEHLKDAHTIMSYPTLNVLFLTARRRTDEADIPLRIESLAVMDSVRDHDLPLRFDLVRPGTVAALVQRLVQAKPGFYHILHLDCHGAGTSGLAGDAYNDNRIVFETERADFTTVGAEEIAELVDEFEIPIVVTSACRSGMNNSGSPSFAYTLFEKSRVQCALAMALSVLVDTTARFVREFYKAILEPHGRQSVRFATRMARLKMRGDSQRNGVMGEIKRLDWWIPQLFERKVGDGSGGGLFKRCTWDEAVHRSESPEEKALVWEDSQVNVKRRHLLTSEPVDENKFLGRNEDLRILECKVFSHVRADNIVLLYGTMGCGKTAFLTYVSWWWCVTGLVKDKFIFRMHERSYTMNKMIWHIYRQLFNVANYDPTNASATQIAEDRRRVTKHLRKHCYVIVMDSAERLCTRESIRKVDDDVYCPLSSHFETEYDSDSEDGRGRPRPGKPRVSEREEIARWLAELQGGRTIVLVGFRGSSESELMRYIAHRSNKLDLATIIRKYPSRSIGNLSPKWSKALVKQILDENGVGSDPRYEALYSYPMLDLYAGNPLVIKLMVSSFDVGDVGNARAPEELYEKLQKHLANPSSSISVKPSLEYSFNQLSSSQQEALLFLAPFKGSVTGQGLIHYADALENDKQSVPTFNRVAWDSAIQMAVRWGLLTYHERMKPQPQQQAWRIHTYLSILLMKKLFHKKASTSRGTLKELKSSRGYGVLDHVDKEGLLCPMLKSMHRAYWKLALHLYDDLRSSEKARHDIGRVMTEIEFWNLKRVLKFALEEKQAFYAILLPLYWYHDAKNDITQRYELCRHVVEQVGTYEKFSDIPTANSVYRMDIPRAYHIYGILLGHNQLDRLQEAGIWFNRTIKIWRACGNKGELAVTEHELGWVAMNKRDYKRARRHYRNALEMSDRLGRAMILHNMGLLEAQEGNYEKAIEYHNDARVIYEEEKDERAVASAYHHMAIVSAKVGRYEDAEHFAKSASTTRKQREETEQHANAYQLRGNIAQRRAREEETILEDALRFLGVAKKKYDKAMVKYNYDNGYHYGVIPEREMLHENYGSLMAAQRPFLKDPVKRTESLKTEMDAYLRIKDGKYPKALYNLGLIYEELGQTEEAFEQYSRAAEQMPSVAQSTVEWEACRRAHLARAKCLSRGTGVERDEHEAICVILRVRGEIGEEDPLEELGLPIS